MARDIDLVVVHCSDTPPAMDIGAEKIREWHTSPSPKDPSKPWRDIGYHFVIRRNGEVEPGRALDVAGAHVAGHNRNSIGICLVGGKAAAGGSADFNFDRAQLRSLISLLETLSTDYPEARLCGHRDLDGQKECPCFDVAAFWGGSTLRRPDDAATRDRVVV